MEKKKMYVAPLTKKTVVELESGFMAESMYDKKVEITKPVDAGDQGIENNYDFTGNEWK